MKLTLIISLLTLSLSALASHHFECHPKSEALDGQRVTFLLVPYEADLTSGASFSKLTDQKYRQFDFEKQLTLGTKRILLTEKATKSLMIVTGTGVERTMVILSAKGNVIETYTCYQESSI